MRKAAPGIDAGAPVSPAGRHSNRWLPWWPWLPQHGNAMLIVHVHVRVKPEFVEAFREATIENARHSVQEAGIARFDVVQQSDDPARFVLVEVYRTADAAAAHKETAHYRVWRDTVAEMMAEPRTGIKYANVFPEDSGW
jgi:quinol monooxygenase YgiN